MTLESQGVPWSWRTLGDGHCEKKVYTESETVGASMESRYGGQLWTLSDSLGEGPPYNHGAGTSQSSDNQLP